MISAFGFSKCALRQIGDAERFGAGGQVLRIDPRNSAFDLVLAIFESSSIGSTGESGVSTLRSTTRG